MHLLRGLSPFGPIFGKELRVAARRRRNYLLRVAYLGGLLLFLLFAWSITHNSSYGARGVAQRAQQQQQLGYYFFAFFSMFCVGAMALIGPVLTSTAINGERQAKTLHVLLMTPITAWQIVSGKLFSRLLTALTLIGLSLPVLALVRLLGGVEINQMFGVVCLCAVTALFGAAVGLLLSIVLRRAFAVIIMSYLTFAVIYFVAPLLFAAMMPRNFGRLPWWSILASYNPFVGVSALGWGQMRFLMVHWHYCVFVHLIATAVLLVLSAFLLRRQTRREGEDTAIMPQEPALMPALAPSPANGDLTLQATSVIEPALSRKARRVRTVSDQPVLWRELRRPLMTRAWQRITGGILVGGLLTLAYVAAAMNDALDEEEFHAFLACCFYSLLMLITCVIAATSIAQEKEGETWTVLLASPLSGSAIVWGKALGVLRRLLWPMLLIVAHFLIFIMIGALGTAETFIALVTCAMFNSIWVATGVALSLKVKKVTTAVIANLALPIALYGAWSLVMAVIDSLFDAGGDFVELVLWYMPYGYLAEGIAGGRGSNDARSFLGDEMPVEQFALQTFVVGLIYVGLAIAILCWTARQFNRTVARAPQLEPLPKPKPASSVSWAAAAN